MNIIERRSAWKFPFVFWLYPVVTFYNMAAILLQMSLESRTLSFVFEICTANVDHIELFPIPEKVPQVSLLYTVCLSNSSLITSPPCQSGQYTLLHLLYLSDFFSWTAGQARYLRGCTPRFASTALPDFPQPWPVPSSIPVMIRHPPNSSMLSSSRVDSFMVPVVLSHRKNSLF